MATTYYNDLQKLYVAYFNRPGDPAGLAYWEGVVEAAKGSTAAVSASFAASNEYKAAYAGMANGDIIDAVYKNLFGHAADADGKKYWTDLLDAKKITIDNAVTQIAGGALGTDLVAYNSKVAAAAAFTAAVDTDAEKAGYSGDAANKVAKAFLSGVTDSVSLATATAPAALNTAVAKTVAAGTPFTVAGALAQVNAAQAALDAYVKATATKDVNADGKKDAADITAAQKAAVTKVAGDLTDTASSNLYATDTTSQTVRDALVAAQQATNAAKLTKVQGDLSADNAAIAKVAGLTDAVSTLTAAQAALKGAQTAEVATRADITAKQAAFGINNGTTSAALSVSGTAMTFTKADGTVVTLADIANGKATLHDGVDATKYTGLTDLIASYNAETTAVANVGKAQANVDNATLVANMLDVAPDTVAGATNNIATVNGTAYTESALIKAIADQINATTPKTVADGATPSLAQIQTELAVLKAQTDQTAYNSFKALVDAETKAAASFNPLVTKQAADTKAVSDASDAIAALSKDVAALQTAQANSASLAGYQASVDAYNAVLKAQGYVVNSLAAANFATASSDIYTVDVKSAPTVATVAAFGLQGNDVLSVGSGFTLVQGAIGAKGVTANDAAMEIFVSTNSTGDAVLQIETHAYSSNLVTSNPTEVITITLTGVDATTLQLNNGIITGHA